MTTAQPSWDAKRIHSFRPLSRFFIHSFLLTQMFLQSLSGQFKKYMPKINFETAEICIRGKVDVSGGGVFENFQYKV